MLHIQMGTPGQKSVIMASGSFHDIFSEVCTVVADLYKQMKVSAPPYGRRVPASLRRRRDRSRHPHVERGAEGRLWHDGRDAREAEGW